MALDRALESLAEGPRDLLLHDDQRALAVLGVDDRIAGDSGAAGELGLRELSLDPKLQEPGSWAPSGASTITYRVTYWLPDIGQVGAPGSQATLDDLQNTSLSTAFTWEAQNA